MRIRIAIVFAAAATCLLAVGCGEIRELRFCSGSRPGSKRYLPSPFSDVVSAGKSPKGKLFDSSEVSDEAYGQRDGA